MSVSKLTAYTIATSPTEILTEQYGDKFAGIIVHSKDHPHHPLMPILSTSSTYPTAGKAKEVMTNLRTKIVQIVKKESGNKPPMDHLAEQVAEKLKETPPERLTSPLHWTDPLTPR